MTNKKTKSKKCVTGGAEASSSECMETIDPIGDGGRVLYSFEFALFPLTSSLLFT
jgi:hypothetical protein